MLTNMMDEYNEFGIKSWMSILKAIVRPSRLWTSYCGIVGLSLVRLITRSMYDRLINVLTWYVFDVI